MKYVPRDYQRLMTDFIIDHQRCQAFVDMGMGKSVSTLTAADILWLAGSNLTPALVIAPLRPARDVWPGEIEKWDHLNGITISPIIGDTPKQRLTALKKKADVYAINYENIPWLVEQFPKKWPFRWVIADESTRLKGFRLRKGTKRAAALSKIAHETGRWVNLTGTPAPRGLIDLWGQTYFIDFGERLGRTYTAFLDRWFDKDEYTRKITAKACAHAEITSLIADITISLNAKDWFDVDGPVHVPVYFDMPRKAKEIYSSMERTMYAELGPDIAVEAMTAAAKSMKCLQMASGAVYTDNKGHWEEVHDAKFRVLEEILDEVGNQPVLVAYWFKSDLARLKKRFPHARVLSSKQDEKDWNAGKIGLAFGHPQSMGHGWNLQDGGCIAVFFSQTWNAEARQQFIERIGPVRQIQSGHPRPVLVYDILARNTTDEAVQISHFEKMSVQDALKEAHARRPLM